MGQMTEFIKHMPDYYTGSGYLVEVMGCGRDRTLKLKLAKYEALRAWNQHQPVMLFVWNSSVKRWMLLDWAALVRHVGRARRAGIKEFDNDHNQYYPISWDGLVADPRLGQGRLP